MNKYFIAHQLQQRGFGLEYLACIGMPMLYDGELYVLRRVLDPGFDTYKWYRGIRLA